MRRVLQGRTSTVLAFVLGVVIATAATAGAASLITGRQIKDGTVSARDLSLAVRQQLSKTGAVGPAGTRGPEGPQGRDGTPGAKGDPGPFPDVLPRGKTVSGQWSIIGQVPDAGAYLDDAISFGFRFATAPSVVTVISPEAGTQAATAAGCRGNVAAPAADPGLLCIYMGSDQGNTAPLKFDDQSNVKTAGGANATVSTYTWSSNGAYSDFATASPTGAVIELQPLLANTYTFAGGSWAATSP